MMLRWHYIRCTAGAMRRFALAGIAAGRHIIRPCPMVTDHMASRQSPAELAGC